MAPLVSNVTNASNAYPTDHAACRCCTEAFCLETEQTTSAQHCMRPEDVRSIYCNITIISVIYCSDPSLASCELTQSNARTPKLTQPQLETI